MTFDQVERYSGAGMVLDLMTKQNGLERPGILDLGGFFTTLSGKDQLPLPLFLPKFKCTVADVSPCDHPDYVKLEPDAPLPFESDAFDFTLCMDVLEHIKPLHRQAFLEDALRVSKYGLVLAAPFFHPEREAADRWLAEFYTTVLDTMNPMLQEHLDNGLPNAKKMESLLEDMGLEYVSFSNGSLGIWHLVMAVKHLLLLSNGPDKSMEFEQAIIPWAQPVAVHGCGYRDIYVICKQSHENQKSEIDNLSLDIGRLKKSLEQKIQSHQDAHGNASQQIEKICGRYLESVGKTVMEFTSTVKQQRTALRDVQMDFSRIKRALKSSKFQNDQLQVIARRLHLENRDKDFHIHSLHEKMISRDKEVLKHVDSYETGLTELRQSAAYRTGQLVLAPIKATVKLIRLLKQGQKPKTSAPDMEGQVTKTPEKTAPEPTFDPRLATLSHTITFSLLVPVYNTDETVLRAMIESVLAQSYPRWQLCLVDDASPDETPRNIMKEYAHRYPEKILCEFSNKNAGIAVTTRKASALATGEFIGLLDHDDLLTEDALMEVARQLEITPDADYIYSDEDKISDDGTEFSQPYFKPDFDPDLLLCNNYLNHFSIIRKTLFDDVGGYREGFDGSQDYDLYLRVTEKARQIAHIPKILYHWRMVPDSTAVDPAAKGGLYRDSSKRVLESAIERRGIKASVENGISPGTYRVKYHVEPGSKVSIIIPTRDAVELVEQCVETIQRHTLYPDYEIVVVDNGSTDPLTLDYLKHKSEESDSFKCLQFDRRFNFSEINNFAVEKTDSPYVVFMNNDIELTDDGWLLAMLEHGQRKEVGAVGAKMLYPDGRIQHAGVILGQGGVAGHPFKEMPENNGIYFGHSNLVKNYSAVTAACLLMRRDVFEEVGGYNEELAVSFGDIDLCMEVTQRGYRIVYTPYARMIHHESVSRLDDNEAPRRPRFHSEITYMISKWGDTLYNDPYLNPNISILKYDMSLRAPQENDTLIAYRQAFRGFNPNAE